MKLPMVLATLLVAATKALASDAYQLIPVVQVVGAISGSGTAIVLNTTNGDIYSCLFTYSTRAPYRVTNKACKKGTAVPGSDPFPSGNGAVVSPTAALTTSPIIWKLDEPAQKLVACGSLPSAPISATWLCTSIQLPN
jgi:hypothetical protein